MPRFSGWVGIAGVLLAASVLVNSPPAEARPQYAVRAETYCSNCHVDPAGGGMRNAKGFDYARGRHSWEVDAKYAEWKISPEITQGIRIGSDLRYAGMASKMKDHYAPPAGRSRGDSPVQAASFGMQGSVYLALQPVEPLLLYFNHDLGAGAMKQRDWWGMIRNLTPLNIYVKAGQIRPPYGLRLEDHTPFVRGRVTAPPGERGAMDLDSRFTLPGWEVGLVKSGVFVHAAFLDPGSTFSVNLNRLREKTVTARAGLNRGSWIVGASGRHNGLGDGDPDTKSTRYGAFGIFGRRQFAVVAEADGGSDQTTPTARTKVQAAYLAGEYYWRRGVTLRAETNYMDFKDDLTQAKTAVSRRLGAGVEWNPIPYLRLSGEARYVSNSVGSAAERAATRDEIWGIGAAVFSF